MWTPVYVKLDATEELLLSEGVCRQLRILSYHPTVAGHRKRLGARVRSPSYVDEIEPVHGDGRETQTQAGGDEVKTIAP